MIESYIILDNVRSVHNVGSVFRTADALGVSKIFLVGTTPAPIDRFGRKRDDLAKVALGAEEVVDWESVKEMPELIRSLQQHNVNIVSVEQTNQANDYRTFSMSKSTAFIFGNEIDGVSKEALDMSDMVIEIPMKGAKESLNVSVSVGIVLSRVLD